MSKKAIPIMEHDTMDKRVKMKIPCLVAAVMLLISLFCLGCGPKQEMSLLGFELGKPLSPEQTDWCQHHKTGKNEFGGELCFAGDGLLSGTCWITVLTLPEGTIRAINCVQNMHADKPDVVEQKFNDTKKKVVAKFGPSTSSVLLDSYGKPITSAMGMDEFGKADLWMVGTNKCIMVFGSISNKSSSRVVVDMRIMNDGDYAEIRKHFGQDFFMK